MGIRIKILIFSLVITVATIVFCFSAVSTTENTQKVKSTSYISVTKKYVLKDFNGRIAIFESTQNTPTEVLDVDLSSLPERDIERIKKGIFADSLSEIYSFAEDYE